MREIGTIVPERDECFPVLEPLVEAMSHKDLVFCLEAFSVIKLTAVSNRQVELQGHLSGSGTPVRDICKGRFSRW